MRRLAKKPTFQPTTSRADQHANIKAALSPFIAAGDMRGALKLACTYRGQVSKADQETLKKALDCLNGKAAFYLQLGLTEAGLVADAKAVFKKYFDL